MFAEGGKLTNLTAVANHGCSMTRRSHPHLTARQVADLVGVHVVTVYRWVTRGEVLPVRIGGRTLFPQAEVRRILERGTRTGRRRAAP